MASTAIMKWKEKVARMRQASARAREKAGEVTQSVLTTAEVAGTAFAIGFWEGKITSPDQFEVFGVPIPLAAGLGAHMFALFGVGRGMEDHLRNIGNGFLAAHVNGVGRALGAKSQATPTTSGELPEGTRRGMGISEADLAAAAMAD